MPKVMLRYRAAAFFGRFYAPDILMGMSSTDEIEDAQFTEIKPIPEIELQKETEPAVIELTPDPVQDIEQPVNPSTEPNLSIERSEQNLSLVKTDLPVQEIGKPLNLTKAEVEAKFAEASISKLPVKTDSRRSGAQSTVELTDNPVSGNLFDPGQDSAPDADAPSLATQLIWELQMAENLKDFQQRKRGIADSYNTLSKADKDRVAEEANRIKASFEGVENNG